jgi:hypothetical protein
MATISPLKKPKLKKHPKAPKAKAATAVWDRYYLKCKEIDKENKAAEAAWKKEGQKRSSIAKGLNGLKK